MIEDERRSLTKQITKEIRCLEDKMREEFNAKINGLQNQIINCTKSINTLTEKLIDIAIHQNKNKEELSEINLLEMMRNIRK